MAGRTLRDMVGVIGDLLHGALAPARPALQPVPIPIEDERRSAGTRR